MPRTSVGCSNTSRKWSSVSTSASATPSPQLVTKERRAMPDSGTTTVRNSHSDEDRRRDPAPAAERQRPLAAGLALDRDELAGVLQQVALQHHQREGHRDDAHRHRRHQVVRRRAELVGELVQVGGEHQVALRIAEHQRQAEDLEAEEEHQHAREEQRRRDHRQAHVAWRPGTASRRSCAPPPRRRSPGSSAPTTSTGRRAARGSARR